MPSSRYCCNCRDNYSFLRFRCDNYSRETIIQRRKLLVFFFLFGCYNLNCCHTMCVKVRKSKKQFFLKLHCSKNERNIYPRAEFCKIFFKMNKIYTNIYLQHFDDLFDAFFVSRNEWSVNFKCKFS